MKSSYRGQPVAAIVARLVIIKCLDARVTVEKYRR
jgi:hypothetical protein